MLIRVIIAHPFILNFWLPGLMNLYDSGDQPMEDDF